MLAHRGSLLPRIAAIEAQSRSRQKQAERWVREHYRAHRCLPRGAVACLLTQRRLYAIIFYGELEHRLGLAPLLLHTAALRRCAAKMLDRLREL